MFPQGTNPDSRVAGFSDQLAILMQPVGALSLKDLADPIRRGDVLETISANTRLAMAQIGNYGSRHSPNETTLDESITWGEFSPVNGTITRRRQRVLQNATVTFFLVGILSLVLAVNAWALFSSIIQRYCRLDK